MMGPDNLGDVTAMTNPRESAQVTSTTDVVSRSRTRPAATRGVSPTAAAQRAARDRGAGKAVDSLPWFRAPSADA
jgi:hypothetical protein